MRIANGTPPLHRNTGIGVMHFDLAIGYFIGEMNQAFNRSIVYTINHTHGFHVGAHHDGLACKSSLKRLWQPLIINCSRQFMHKRRTIKSGLHIIFTAPHQFHRRALCPACNVDRLKHIIRIGIGTSTKTTAGENRVNFHVFDTSAQQSGNGGLITGGSLAAIPEFCTLTINLSHTVHGFHLCMSQVRELEYVFNHVVLRQCAPRVAYLLCNDTWLIDQFTVFVQNGGTASCFSSAVIPLNLKQLSALDSRPVVSRQHRNAGFNFKDLLYTLPLQGFTGIKTTHFATKPGGVRNHRGQHTWQLNVLRVDGRAIVFAIILANQVFTSDQFELGGILKRYSIRSR